MPGRRAVAKTHLPFVPEGVGQRAGVARPSVPYDVGSVANGGFTAC